MRFWLMIAICLILCSGMVYSQTVDDYTVGTGGDFLTLGEVAQFLDTTTAVRSIVFNILSGEYNEHITINEVAGASADNQIIFQSAVNDPDSVRIYYEATDADSNYVIKLNGADHIIIQDLTLEAQNINSGDVIVLIGDPNHVQILNNKFISITGGYYATFGIRGSSASPDTLLVSGNEFNNFSGGAIKIVAPGGQDATGLVISQNIFTNTSAAIYVQRFSGPVISENRQDNSTSYGSAGIQLYNCYGAIRVIKNRIILYSGYGIFLWNCGNSSQRSLIANNFIEGVPQKGSFYGIQLDNGSYCDIYYNTVIEDHSPQAFGGVFNIGGTGNNVSNNLIVSRLGVVAIGYTSSNVNGSDYNNIYSSGREMAIIDGVRYPNLDSLKAGSSFEQNSQDIYPIMNTLYEPYHQSPWLNGAGTPVAEVTDDIDGNPRDPSTPDIGCTEYTPDPSMMTPMSGAYTVGDGGDFGTINGALDTLMIRGISGLTELNILPGEYKESIFLRSIPGTTEHNEVIFSSSTGFPDDAHIQYPTGTDDNYAFYFDGADHIGINSLTIERDTDYTSGSGNAITFNGEVSDISIIGNYLYGSTPGYGQDYVFYAYGMYTNRLYVGFNKIVNTGYGNGAWLRSMYDSKNVIFQSNEFIARDMCCIIDGAYDLQLLDNRFQCTNGGAAQVTYCNGPIVINGNEFIREGSYGQILEIRGCHAPADSLGLIANNFIHGKTNGWYVGVLFNGCSNQNIYHNNISATTKAWGSAAVHVDYGGSNLNFKNNIIVNSAGGLTYNIGYTNAFNSSDFNDLYSTGDSLLLYGGEYYPTVDSFFTVTGFDQNSISADPCFYSQTDLHVRAGELDNAGSFVAEVTQDYDGDYRTNPGCDIGADEFFYMPNDAPVAVDDSVVVYENITASIDLLLNDYDINGDSLRITYWSESAHGDLDQITGSIAFEYTPDLDYIGPDSFYYVITDGLGCYDDTAWVFIDIQMAVDVRINQQTGLPTAFVLGQNYPNPFNPTTEISFALPERSFVRLEIYNLLGRKIKTLVNDNYPAGAYSISWQGRDSDGHSMASGIYFYKIKTERYSDTKKMILLK